MYVLACISVYIPVWHYSEESIMSLRWLLYSPMDTCEKSADLFMENPCTNYSSSITFQKLYLRMIIIVVLILKF